MSKTCIIIPCFNEFTRIKTEEFVKCIRCNNNIDFLFVNDGSTDLTLQKLQEIKNTCSDRIEIISNNQNLGKAESIRVGVLIVNNQNIYDYIGYWDADLSTPLDEIEYFINAIKTNKLLIIGSRFKRVGSSINRKWYRHVLGRIFSTFASLILKLPIYDTQCGAKLFKAELADCFKKPFITKWLFDIEIIARMQQRYKKNDLNNNIYELPLNSWHDVSGSKLRLKHIVWVPFQLILIYCKYKKNDY